METVDQARETIFKELTSDDSEVRRDYLKLFEGDAKAVADAMATAFIKWREFDNGVKGDEKRAHVSALVYAAITLHVLSTKLFISGQTVAAGNLFRQVIESIALALLCSGKDLDVLKRFMEDRYSSSDAVRDVLRHHAVGARLVVTDISTFGWLISNVDTATTPLLWAAVVAVAALTIGIFLLHRRINRHVQFLREL
jgi:hypothetical protein